MHIEYFDVNRIVTISLFGERDAGFEWRDPQPITKFFGLIYTGEFTTPGYQHIDSTYDDYIYTKEELLNLGYKVYDRDERLSINVVRKPYVKVDLEHDNSVTVKFETEDDMLKWVEEIKKLTNKTFGVKYN